MKSGLIAFAFIFNFFASVSAEAKGQPCSIGLAEKFAGSVIDVQLSHNKDKGTLSFQKNKSYEYTRQYLDEQIRLIERGAAIEKYKALKEEIIAKPQRNIYYLQFKFAEDSGNSGFYLTVRLNNYSDGCSFESMAINE